MNGPARSLVRREHRGGHTYKLDGEPAPGVTTALNAGFPKPAIAQWKANKAGECVLNEWPALEAMAPSERYAWVRNASDRDRDAGARRGTEVHEIAAHLAAGDTVDVSDEIAGHVDAYLRFAREWRPRELLVEGVIAKRKPRYCGTLDMIADLNDGNRWLLDLKTTRSGVYAENALQLAAYRYADFYLDGGGNERPLWAVDRCGVVWLRGDRTYELTPVEAGQREFALFQMAMRIGEFADPKFAAKYAEHVEVVGAPLVPTQAKEMTT